MPNDTWSEWSRPPPPLRSLADGRRPGFEGTLSLDHRHVLSDSVVIGMVSHKLDAETQYETGETRRDTANLAHVVSMDSLDEMRSRTLASEA